MGDSTFDSLLDEFATLKGTIPKGPSAIARDAAERRDLEARIKIIDADIKAGRGKNPNWDTIPISKAIIWIPDLPKSKEHLKTQRESTKAKGTHDIQIAKFAFNKGGVRAAFHARIRKEGEVEWKPYVAKSFHDPRNQNRKEYLDQLETNGVLMFLARQWMKSNGTPEIKCIESRAVEVTQSDGLGKDVIKVHWFHLENVIEGEWAKWTDNKGCTYEPKKHTALLKFAQWTHDYTDGLLMATDLQGGKTAAGYNLTDPAIICPTQMNRFGGTNGGGVAQLRLCYEAVKYGLKHGTSGVSGKLSSVYHPSWSSMTETSATLEAAVDAFTAKMRAGMSKAKAAEARSAEYVVIGEPVFPSGRIPEATAHYVPLEEPEAESSPKYEFECLDIDAIKGAPLATQVGGLVLVGLGIWGIVEASNAEGWWGGLTSSFGLLGIVFIVVGGKGIHTGVGFILAALGVLLLWGIVAFFTAVGWWVGFISLFALLGMITLIASGHFESEKKEYINAAMLWFGLSAATGVFYLAVEWIAYAGWGWGVALPIFLCIIMGALLGKKRD